MATSKTPEDIAIDATMVSRGGGGLSAGIVRLIRASNSLAEIRAVELRYSIRGVHRSQETEGSISP